MSESSEIPFSEPFIDEQEAVAVLRVIRGKWLTTGGEAKAFEEEMKTCLGGVRAVVAVSSGTAAIDVALAACGIGDGDDVVTSAYSFVSPTLSILHRGARPFFADVDPRSFNLSPEKVEAVIDENYRLEGGRMRHRRDGRTLKAVLIVHFGGQPADIDAFVELGRTYRLHIIEDAAHAVGSRYKGKAVGASGNPVCFSFYSNKNLTTGEGGMVVWNRPGVEKILRTWSLHGISKSNLERYQTGMPFYDVMVPGYKANMNDLAAAMGRVQLGKLDEITSRREAAAALYDRELSKLETVSVPFIEPWAKPSRHLYPLLLSPDQAGRRDELIRFLRSRNIFPSVHFIPVHHHIFFCRSGLEKPHLPVTEDLFRREISLPLYPSLEEEQILRVTSAIRDFFASAG